MPKLRETADAQQCCPRHGNRLAEAGSRASDGQSGHYAGQEMIVGHRATDPRPEPGRTQSAIGAGDQTDAGLLKRADDVAQEARADAYIAVGKAKHIVLRAIQHVRKIGDFPVGSVHPAVYHDRYIFLGKTRAQYVDGS